MPPEQGRTPPEYTVGWICALSTELVAAQTCLDEKHEGLSLDHISPNDNNNYTLGGIGGHNVVIAVLPNGEIGLMVGIGGGAPSSKHDIRLDVVVSVGSRAGKGAVFQYDFGKTVQDREFQETGMLNQPPTILRSAVNGLKAQYELEGHQLEETIASFLDKRPKLRRGYKRPDAILQRERTNEEDSLAIHYGMIASANRLMKDAIFRDKLAYEKEVLCFEMEAAGLMNHFPCLVIRGICDCSDTHKNKAWQGYAAMAAAAYAKELLARILPRRVEAEQKIVDIIYGVKKDVDELVDNKRAQELQGILDWLAPIDYASQQSDFIHQRQEGTGQWLLDSPEFKTWLNTSGQTLFCPGIPGAGKTMLTSIVIDHLTSRFANDEDVGIDYVYCDFRRQNEQKPQDLLGNLVKQLSQRKVFSAQAYGCRKKFLAEIAAVQANSGANLIATSRFILEITEIFANGPSIEIRASDLDVRRYIDGHISHLPSFVATNPDLQEDIKNSLVKAVDGMFLLARLHLNSLIGKRSHKAIRIALTKLSSGSGAYDSAYKDAMHRIEGQLSDQEVLAKQALSWIFNAKRLLTTLELQHALVVGIKEQSLDEENLPAVKDVVSFPGAKADITKACICYLSFDSFKSGFSRSDEEYEYRTRAHPLYDYAARH
ncbi:nucleoside phosphorylase domain-containing protein [Podospora didyma]|uniref:Nucleoside phosphorylase domain-containing protein n=1 Tax=Podospora didyma TaxID=330526 RepID=A0AAE0P7S2_9PEZI|nr:nucleoside phosphorylase domain-containing protein [Podospora didyma]